MPKTDAYRSPVIAEKRWQTFSLLLLGVLLAAGMLVAIVLSSLMSRIVESRLTRHQLDLARVIISIVCIQGAAVLWIHLFLKCNDTTWGEAFGLSQHNYGRCAALAVLALILVFIGMAVLGNISTAILNALYESLHWKWLKPEPQQIVQILRNEWPWSLIVVQGVAAIVIAPVSEELIFRGVLYTFLKQRGHAKLALWISSALFALVHLHPVGFLSFIFLAMVLTALYERTQNIFAPILLHSLFNGVSFTFIVANPKWAEKWINQ